MEPDPSFRAGNPATRVDSKPTLEHCAVAPQLAFQAHPHHSTVPSHVPFPAVPSFVPNPAGPMYAAHPKAELPHPAAHPSPHHPGFQPLPFDPTKATNAPYHPHLWQPHTMNMHNSLMNFIAHRETAIKHMAQQVADKEYASAIHSLDVQSALLASRKVFEREYMAGYTALQGEVRQIQVSSMTYMDHLVRYQAPWNPPMVDAVQVGRYATPVSPHYTAAVPPQYAAPAPPYAASHYAPPHYTTPVLPQYTTQATPLNGTDRAFLPSTSVPLPPTTTQSQTTSANPGRPLLETAQPLVESKLNPAVSMVTSLVNDNAHTTSHKRTRDCSPNSTNMPVTPSDFQAPPRIVNVSPPSDGLLRPKPKATTRAAQSPHESPKTSFSPVANRSVISPEEFSSGSDSAWSVVKQSSSTWSTESKSHIRKLSLGAMKQARDVDSRSADHRMSGEALEGVGQTSHVEEASNVKGANDVQQPINVQQPNNMETQAAKPAVPNDEESDNATHRRTQARETQRTPTSPVHTRQPRGSVATREARLANDDGQSNETASRETETEIEAGGNGASRRGKRSQKRPSSSSDSDNPTRRLRLAPKFGDPFQALPKDGVRWSSRVSKSTQRYVAGETGSSSTKERSPDSHTPTPSDKTQASQPRKRGRPRKHPLPVFPFDEKAKGYKVQIYWPDDQVFYKGVVGGYNASNETHKVEYDDGEIEWLALRTQRMKWYNLSTKRWVLM